VAFDILAHVNRAVSAGWLVLAVLLLRLLLKTAPRRFHCLLWALAALRLVLPVSIPSDLSLQPSAEPVVQQVVLPPEVSLPAAVQPVLQSGVPLLDAAVNPILSHAAVPVTGASATDWTAIFGWVWAAGVGLMLLYLLLSCLRLRRQVREAAPVAGRVWQCDHIATPFIFGVFRPRIYLPSNLNDADAVLVLAHERAHLRRGDHIWKPFGFLLLTLYWFHPLLWLGYILLCRDIELACDEKVLETLGAEHKKDYSTALINCSAPRRMLTACPLAFGESDIRQRVKAALHYKKPAFWLLLAASAAVLATAVCFLTDPKQEENVPASMDEEIAAEGENFFAQAVDLSGGVFTPRGFDFYTPDAEVLSALGLDKSALTEERENTGAILLRGQTLGFASDVSVRYDFYLGRLHSVRYQVTVQPGEIDSFRARLASQAAYLPDPADQGEPVTKLKTGSIRWYDPLRNSVALEIIRNTSPADLYYVNLTVRVSQENLKSWVNAQGWVEETLQEKALRMGLAPAGDPKAYSTILGDPTVYALEDSSLDPTKAAHTLAKQVLEAHTVPSGNRTFLLTAYNAIATRCTPTAEADPSYALQPHEIAENTWIVEFEAEFRYVGAYSPMGYEGDRWHTTLYTGSPVGWLLTKTPTGWILHSRLSPILPQEKMAAWVAALSQTSSVLSGDPVRIAEAVAEHSPEIDSIREEAILWCWTELYSTRHNNGYAVGPDTVYADTSAQSRIQAALLQDLIAQEDPDSNIKQSGEVFKQLWLYGNQCHSVYLKAMNDGADEPLKADWFSACSVRYLTMVARLRNPFLRIIATPFERIAGVKDDVALVWATELFAKVLMQGEPPAGVTVSDEALLSDGSFFTEHARWQLAQLRDHIYTLTIAAPDGHILTLTCDTAQNPPR